MGIPQSLPCKKVPYKMISLFAVIFTILSSFLATNLAFGPGGPPDHFVYLANVPDSVRITFFEMMFNPNSTKAEKKQALASFAQTNGFGDHYNNQIQQQQAMDAQIEAAAAQNLAGQALQVYNQIQQIHKDDTLTDPIGCQRISEVLKGTDPVVAKFVPKMGHEYCGRLGTSADEADDGAVDPEPAEEEDGDGDEAMMANEGDVQEGGQVPSGEESAQPQ